MQNDFWHDKWARNEIGFHQVSVNDYLREHWSVLELHGNEPVFVPLCGKSLDMHWIHDKGHPILGVEISEQACRQFFDEAGLSPEVSRVHSFTRFQADRYTLYCGDFFELTPELLSDVGAAYDRAALIALPKEQRRAYAQRLGELLPITASVLLVAMEYPPEEMDGPPFSVPEAEVHQLFEGRFQVELIHENEPGRDDPFAKFHGISDMQEKVYRLSP